MIFLTILGIIGKLLLALVCIILVSIFLLLFIPVRYKVKGEFKEGVARCCWRISWLLGLASLNLTMENWKWDFDCGIAWKRYNNFSVHENSDKGSEEFETDNSLLDTESEEDVVNGNLIKGDEFDDVSDLGEKAYFKESEMMNDVESKSKNMKKKRIKKSPSKIKKISGFVTKIKKNINNPEIRKSFISIKSSSYNLVKAFLPRKLKIDLQFSMGSPDTTGIILGAFAMFSVGYKNKWNIVPDFESDKLYAEGSYYGRGRVSTFSVLIELFKLFMDKNFRKVFNNIVK